jgi:hypothetical protein
VGQFPFIAFRPFFIVSSTPLTISFLALHLTQYPSGIEKVAAATLHARGSYENSLEAACWQRQQRKDRSKISGHKKHKSL